MTGQITRKLTTFLFAIGVCLPLLLAACSELQTREAPPVSGDDRSIESKNITIRQSPNDSREYAYFKLANGLQVMLVSDPDSDKSAASLDLNIGSGSDPDDRPGLAHFLEHMLFLGTEKYPDAGEYQAYISQHGGSHNAFTSFNHTNYFFDVNPEFFEDALDRFAQFFTAPLFNSEYVDREKHAVNSEYSTRLKDDGRAQYDVFKTLINPRHPYRKFSVGSLETLADKPTSTVREELLNFYKQHYSANLMTLAVTSNTDIPTLKALIETKFGEIPNRNTLPLRSKESLFKSGTLPLQVNIVPNKDVRQLSLLFPMPPTQVHYKSKPTNYIANLLGHEGKGSLLSYLKERGWADSLSAGEGLGSADFSTFQISISLTKAGIEYVDDIVAATFSAVSTIKEDGIERWRYEEQKQLSNINFQFLEQSSGARYVTHLAGAMHRFPVMDVISAPILMHEFDSKLINQYLGYLRPENMFLSLVALDVQTDKTSPWFNANYSASPIDKIRLKNWRNPASIAAISLPDINPFIPEGLALLSDTDANKPTKLSNGNGLEVWHLTDTEFGTPKSDFYFTVRSPLANSSPRHHLLTELWVRAVTENLNEFAYPAFLANLNYQLYKHMRGISVRISGYQDKQPLLLDKIAATLKSPVLTDDMFERFRDDMRREIRNRENDRPYGRALNRVSQLMLNPSYADPELINVLPTLTVGDLETFIKEFLNDVDMVALANGNISENMTLEMAETLRQNFGYNATTQDVARAKVAQLNAGHSFLYDFTVNHPDSAVASYFQGDQKDLTTLAMFRMFNQVLSNPFYQQLRTEQQLGYVVFTTPMTLLDVPAIAFVIQSSNSDAASLEQHIDNFISEFAQSSQNLSEEEYKKHQMALVTKLRERDTRLAQRSNRYWTEIDRENYDFDFRNQLAEAILTIPLAQFNSALKEYLLGRKSRRLTVTADGLNNENKPILLADYTEITGAEELRKDGSYFGG